MKVLGCFGFCVLSLMFAAFLAAWGPSSLMEMYIPRLESGGILSELFVLLVLYSPIFYVFTLAILHFVKTSRKKK